MNRILSITFGLSLPIGLLAQVTVPSTYGSRSGYGNILYPGTGRAPEVRYSTNVNRPTFPIGTGAVARPPAVRHQTHGRGVAVAYPVYVGGYYGGGYYTGFDTPQPAYYPEPGAPAAQAPAPPPVIIINQAYRPESANPVMRDYSNLPEPTLRNYEAPVHPTPDPKAQAESERPTIYLIAFKDHTVLSALAYWVDGDTLNYVTRDGKPNRASLSLVDRDFSRQLNKELRVEFDLP